LGTTENVGLGRIFVFVDVAVLVGNNVAVTLAVHVGRLVRVPVGEGVKVDVGVYESSGVTLGTGVSS